MAERTNNDALIETAQKAVAVQALHPGELIAAPSNGVAVLDLERYDTTPRRKRGTVALTEAASLIDYVKKHCADDVTELFSSWEQGRIIAVLNGHGDEIAGWGDHRATLQLQATKAWRRWTELDSRLVSQTDFAEHIENSLPEIVEPTAADMLEIAQTFQANTSVAFRSGQRLQSGETQLRYEEQHDAKAGAQGQLVIPETFTLALAPWEGSDTYKVTARLRYRIGGGNLKLAYVLDRPDDILRAAFADITAAVAEQTGYTPLAGQPPAGI